jgi:hypothetical protein
LSVGLEINHERLATADGAVGAEGVQLMAIRALYARMGGQKTNGTLALDLAEISGVPAELFLDLGIPDSRITYPERVLVEDPPVPPWRPYVNVREVNDTAVRHQVVVAAYGPDPPKTELPKQAADAEDTLDPAGISVLTGTASDRIRELKRLQALSGLPETSSGIDVMTRFHEAVVAEVPQILLDMTSAGHAIGEVRVEAGKFQALAKLIVQRMIDPDRRHSNTPETYTSPLETVAEQQVVSRGVWRAVTGRLKRLAIALRQ